MPHNTQTREIILVVDDSPDTLSMVTDALEETGATVLVALGGRKALELIEKVTPDVILMDCVMPDLDGFMTCEQLKTNHHLQHVPVIFMTGLSETDHIIKGFKVGGVDYLTKPIVPEELIARMNAHMANARQTKNARSALDDARKHLIAVNDTGDIKWATPEAISLLENACDGFIKGSNRLPENMMSLVDTHKNNDSQTNQDIEVFSQEESKLLASYIGQSDANEYLFRLVEVNDAKDQKILMERFHLTQREAEVLLWVAHGKSNKDIADILEISPRTINKHLQPIFTKLGIENRTSAATITIKSLWGG